MQGEIGVAQFVKHGDRLGGGVDEIGFGLYKRQRRIRSGAGAVSVDIALTSRCRAKLGWPSSLSMATASAAVLMKSASGCIRDSGGSGLAPAPFRLTSP